MTTTNFSLRTHNGVKSNSATLNEEYININQLTKNVRRANQMPSIRSVNYQFNL